MSKRVTVSPMDATHTEICRMRRDHTDYEGFSLMTDGYTVWLSDQIKGQEQKQQFTISKGRFNRLLRWYLREAKLVHPMTPEEIAQAQEGTCLQTLSHNGSVKHPRRPNCDKWRANDFGGEPLTPVWPEGEGEKE